MKTAKAHLKDHASSKRHHPLSVFSNRRPLTLIVTIYESRIHFIPRTLCSPVSTFSTANTHINTFSSHPLYPQTFRQDDSSHISVLRNPPLALTYTYPSPHPRSSFHLSIHIFTPLGIILLYHLFIQLYPPSSHIHLPQFTFIAPAYPPLTPLNPERQRHIFRL